MGVDKSKVIQYRAIETISCSIVLFHFILLFSILFHLFRWFRRGSRRGSRKGGSTFCLHPFIDANRSVLKCVSVVDF